MLEKYAIISQGNPHANTSTVAWDKVEPLCLDLSYNMQSACKQFTPCTCTFLTCTKQSVYETLKLKCSENEMSKQRRIKKANSEEW